MAVPPGGPILLGVFGRKTPPVEQRALEAADVPWMVTPGLSGVVITQESALRIVDVLACVRLLAESASVCPLHTYRRTGEARTRTHGPLAMLLERPAPATSQANLVASTVASLALRGNAYWGKFRDAEGRIAQLAVIPADRVSVELASVGAEPVYTLMSDQGVSRHTSEDILHLRGVSFDGIYGVSPLSQAREALGLAAAMGDTASALLATRRSRRAC